MLNSIATRCYKPGPDTIVTSSSLLYAEFRHHRWCWAPWQLPKVFQSCWEGERLAIYGMMIPLTRTVLRLWPNEAGQTVRVCRNELTKSSKCVPQESCEKGSTKWKVQIAVTLSKMITVISVIVLMKGKVITWGTYEQSKAKSDHVQKVNPNIGQKKK